jgi:UDP-glucose 4-epimerase
MPAKRDAHDVLVITGVGGFIGSQVARRLISEGRRVVGVDDFSTGKHAVVPEAVDLVEADLSDRATIELLPQSAAAILHLAGQSSGEISFDDPIGDLNKNVISTLNLCDYADIIRTQRFVFASSMSVYGAVGDTPVREDASLSPLSCYGVGKAASEGYLRVFCKRTPFVALRMFNVYGPGQDMSNLRQGMVSIYLAQALASGRIIVKGSPKRYRDFIYIDDVVEAWHRSLVTDSVLNQSINVGTGVRTEVGELLELIQRLVPGTVIEYSDGTPGDQFGIYSETGKMVSLLGITETIPLAEGLRRFVGTST